MSHGSRGDIHRVTNGAKSTHVFCKKLWQQITRLGFHLFLSNALCTTMRDEWHIFQPGVVPGMEGYITPQFCQKGLDPLTIAMAWPQNMVNKPLFIPPLMFQIGPVTHAGDNGSYYPRKTGGRTGGSTAASPRTYLRKCLYLSYWPSNMRWLCRDQEFQMFGIGWHYFLCGCMGCFILNVLNGHYLKNNSCCFGGEWVLCVSVPQVKREIILKGLD